jgi:hypothetical protein
VMAKPHRELQRRIDAVIGRLIWSGMLKQFKRDRSNTDEVRLFAFVRYVADLALFVAEMQKEASQQPFKAEPVAQLIHKGRALPCESKSAVTVIEVDRRQNSEKIVDTQGIREQGFDGVPDKQTRRGAAIVVYDVDVRPLRLLIAVAASAFPITSLVYLSVYLWKAATAKSAQSCNLPSAISRSRSPRASCCSWCMDQRLRMISARSGRANRLRISWSRGVIFDRRPPTGRRQR